MVKRLKDKNAPKKPLSGFIIFGNHLRANDSSLKALPVAQQATAISAKWNALSENEKKEYTDQADKLKEAYVKEFEYYKTTDEYKEFQEKLHESKNDKSESTTKKRKRGPVKMSGYRLFVKENKDAVANETDAEYQGLKHIAICGLKWKKLSDEQKKEYNDRAAAMEPTAAPEVSEE